MRWCYVTLREATHRSDVLVGRGDVLEQLKLRSKLRRNQHDLNAPVWPPVDVTYAPFTLVAAVLAAELLFSSRQTQVMTSSGHDTSDDEPVL